MREKISSQKKSESSFVLCLAQEGVSHHLEVGASVKPQLRYTGKTCFTSFFLVARLSNKFFSCDLRDIGAMDAIHLMF